MPNRLLEFTDSDDDPRQDHSTRARLREIVAGLVAWQRQVDRRYWYLTWALIAMVILATAAGVAGYGLLQGQRWDSIRSGCDRTNQQAEATVALLRDVGAREDVILAAQARYPHTPPLAHRAANGVIVMGPPPNYGGALTCEEFADGQVGAFRL